MAANKLQNVAIIGASDKHDRYSYKAFKMLKAFGHQPFPVHPRIKDIEGIPCYQSIAALRSAKISIDTVTLYLRAALSTPLERDLLDLMPRRVIFNPGAENPPLAQTLQSRGIEPIEGCTLIMLQAGTF